MEEKHKDLKSSKQRKLLKELLSQMSKQHPDFYYLSTSDIAVLMLEYIDQHAQLNAEQRGLLKGLSHHDIQIILSLH